jgi:tetratricopeptide (TPR) repeat protein
MLGERLTRFEQSGDPSALLDEQAAIAAAELLRRLQREADAGSVVAGDADLEILGNFHYYRQHYLPHGSDEQDLQRISALGRPARPGGQASGSPVRRRPAMVSLVSRWVCPPGGRGDDKMPGWRLGLQLHMFMTTGEPGALDQAVISARTAVNRSRPRHRDRAAALALLGTALRVRFEHRGDGEDLASAVTACREAVAQTPRHDRDQPRRMGDLGVALQARFRATGDSGSLDEAIALLRRAAARRTRDSDRSAELQSNLGAALLSRFSGTGEERVLDEAIRCHRAALATMIPGWSDGRRARCLARLGAALRHRYELLGDAGDLDASVAACREAAQLIPSSHHCPGEHMSELGLTMLAGFRASDRIWMLDEAITSLERAVSVTPAGHVDLADRHSQLGAALLARYERAGDRADLDAAVAAARCAADTGPPGWPTHPAHLRRLSAALRAQSASLGDPAGLDEAIRAAEAARAAIPDEHPDRAAACTELGFALHARSLSRGSADDLAQAIRCWQEAHNVTAAAAHTRIAAARAWGEAAARADDVLTAAAGFAAAVRQIPALAWHGLDRVTRSEHLADLGGLPRDAAAFAIRAGQPEQAVELLELGRSVLWTQALGLRSDVSAAEREAPALARRLAAVSRELDTPAEGHGGDGPRTRQAAENRMRLAREWDDLIQRIRERPGLTHFLAPTPYAQLRRCGAAGPVAIVNVSRYGCHAMIVRHDEPRPQVIELQLSAAETADRANAWLEARNQAERGNRSRTAWTHLRLTLTATLEWLWQTVAEPVLSACGYHSAEPGPGTPRLWWCPTGPLALLPLHAAGQKDAAFPNTGSATVPGRIVPSYTPTLAALIRARDRPAPRLPAGRSAPWLLAVGMARTPSAAPLPGATRELDAVTLSCPPHTRLADSEATIANVRQALESHPWAHLACHGSQDLTDPNLAALHLHDGPLTIASIAALRLDHADLAFMSACHAAAGNPGLVDEDIHLAGAMHVAGYRHVIATQWFISDTHAPDVARDVYQILGAQRGRADHAADALHHAIRAMRVRHPDQPEIWAPYVHIGP